MPIQVTPQLSIPDHELFFSAIRAQGSGGQNVNKVSSAIHLRFDIRASSLPREIKHKLLSTRDQRITSEGVIVIKAQRFRTQEKNRDDAIARLKDMVQAALHVDKPRKPTRPSLSSKRKALDKKSKHGQLKALRRKPVDD